MTFDREEFEEMRQSQVKEKMNGQRQGLEMIAQAEVKMTNMTGDGNWDTFLSYLQSALEALKQQAASFEEILVSPDLIDDLEIRKIKSSINQLKAKIETLEWVIYLPRAIQEKGEEARPLLDA